MKPTGDKKHSTTGIVGSRTDNESRQRKLADETSHEDALTQYHPTTGVNSGVLESR